MTLRHGQCDVNEIQDEYEIHRYCDGTIGLWLGTLSVVPLLRASTCLVVASRIVTDRVRCDSIRDDLDICRHISEHIPGLSDHVMRLLLYGSVL